MAQAATLLPAPVGLHLTGDLFTLRPDAEVHAAPGCIRAGELLAASLRPATGFPIPVRTCGTDAVPVGGVALLLTGAERVLGAEGYHLDVTATAVTLRANTESGIVHGTQTLRQLLPAAIERSTAQRRPWPIPGVRIVDHPRYPYRGLMLDVARHFFSVAEIKRVVDLSSRYKLNHLHLHLTDDQGWRIAIESWPLLASVGGASEVGGGPGGCYSTDDYREIVAYAADRHVTVVPEVDIPGHTTAALASYPELNHDGVAPPRYTGIEVGFSALCVEKELTYRFLDDVFGELARLTPGPYLHIGGDEAMTLPVGDYAAIVERAQQIVRRHGKAAVGWHEITAASVEPSTVVQYWGSTPAPADVLAAMERGAPVIMSPAARSYLDMTYDDRTPVGQSWAGHIAVRDAYGWDPATYVSGVDPAAVLGVEATLWTETIRTFADVELMLFPRLPAIAEVAWSPQPGSGWADFRRRLGAHAAGWDALGVAFYRAPDVPWLP